MFYTKVIHGDGKWQQKKQRRRRQLYIVITTMTKTLKPTNGYGIFSASTIFDHFKLSLVFSLCLHSSCNVNGMNRRLHPQPAKKKKIVAIYTITAKKMIHDKTHSVLIRHKTGITLYNLMITHDI